MPHSSLRNHTDDNYWIPPSSSDIRDYDHKRDVQRIIVWILQHIRAGITGSRLQQIISRTIHSYALHNPVLFIMDIESFPEDYIKEEERKSRI